MTDSTHSQSKSLHHVAFTTRDVEATYDFYANKLGMKLLHTENHRHGKGYFRHFFFGIGSGEAIAFFAVDNVGESKDFKTEISTGLGLPVWANHIAFRLDTMEELDAMIARMKAAGLEAQMKVDHGWCSSVYTLDPNGIMVEFCVTTDAKAFEQTEEEALRLLRQPASEITEGSRKDETVAQKA